MSNAAPVAIVTDGMWRKSLSAIRSLGKAGYDVHVFGDSWLTVGFWSRFTKRRVTLPDAKDRPADFGAAFRKYLERLGPSAGSVRPVLLPMEEETLTFVVANADELRAKIDFLTPSADSLAVCASKIETMATAERLGIPCPRTVTANSASELLAAVARMDGEFVTKPAAGSGSRGVRYNPAFTNEEAEQYSREFGPVLVQERIMPGGDAIGVSVLYGSAGEHLAHFSHKRLQEFPNSGGPSTDRVGIVDDNLLAMSLRLLDAINWRGVAMVEWKTDPSTGAPKLMEINPRFWGSLELAIRSGVDFPLLYARAASGRPQVAPTQKTGIRCRWLLPGDILRWLTAAKGKRETLSAFLKGLPGSAEEWDGRDVSGFLSCIICQGLAVLRPKYLKMMRR